MSGGRHRTVVTIPAELVDAVRDVCTRRHQTLQRLGLEAYIKVVAKEVGRSLRRDDPTHEEVYEALALLSDQNVIAMPAAH